MQTNNFLTAIYNQLSNIFKLSTTVVNKIYFFEAPQDIEFPYVVYDVISLNNEDVFAEDGRRYIVRVWLYASDDSAITFNNDSDLIINDMNYGSVNFSCTDATLVCSRLMEVTTNKFENRWIKMMTFEYLIQEA